MHAMDASIYQIPLQLAGSTTHVVFVVGANTNQSKKEM